MCSTTRLFSGLSLMTTVCLLACLGVVVSVVGGCDGTPSADKSSADSSRAGGTSVTAVRSNNAADAQFTDIRQAVWSKEKLSGESLTPTQFKESQLPAKESTDEGAEESTDEDAEESTEEGKEEGTEASEVPVPSTGQDVLLAGRIDAGDSPAFNPNESAFIISQLPDEGHGDDPDHADNCPFCKRRLKNAPKAIVQIKDDSGELLPISADQLLGLKKGDAVLVSGSARYDETMKMIFVQAKKISLR